MIEFNPARIFAVAAHCAVGQVRKYTGEPYYEHPEAVARLLINAGVASYPMVQAALLHDVVEDTGVSITTIEHIFGREVSDMVDGLTNKSKPEDGNRVTRVAIDQAALALQSAEVQTIKLADLIDNTKSIVQHDPKFAETYLVEKAALLAVLTKAHPTMIAMARSSLNSSLEKLKAIA